MALVRAAGDLIDRMDPLAAECGEVNALRREGGALAGFARDPVSVGRVVDEIWPEGDHVVCLGAGGTAIALGRHLLARPAAPNRLTFTDRIGMAGEHLRAVLGRGPAPAASDSMCTSAKGRGTTLSHSVHIRHSW